MYEVCRGVEHMGGVGSGRQPFRKIKEIKVKDNHIPTQLLHIRYCEKCTLLIKGNKLHCIECLEYYRIY